ISQRRVSLKVRTRHRLILQTTFRSDLNDGVPLQRRPVHLGRVRAMSFPYTLRDAAGKLNGEVSGGEILCPGPGHSHKDRSLAVRIDPNAPDGFVVFSHAGDDPLSCKDHVRDMLGLPAFQQQRTNGRGPDRFSLDALVRAAQSAAADRNPSAGAPTATYHYKNWDGALLYDVLRYDNPKTFRHRLPDGTFKGAEQRVIYNWPESHEQPDAPAYITE